MISFHLPAVILLGKFFFHMLVCGRGFVVFPVSHAPRRWLACWGQRTDDAEVTANIARAVFGKISVIVQGDHFMCAFTLPFVASLKGMPEEGFCVFACNQFA